MNAQTGSTYTLSYSTTTYKVTLACATSMTIGTSNLTQALGFVAAQSGTSITATNAYNLGSWDMFWNIQLTNVPSNYGNKSVYKTYSVPMLVDTGYVNYHLEKSTFEQYTNVDGVGALGHLQVNLIDAYGNAVDLNGVEWSFLIRIDYDV